jgi:hypothetical protein
MSNKTNSDNNQKRRDALDHARRAAEYARLANLAVNDRIRSELLHLRQAALRSAEALGMPMHEAIAISIDAISIEEKKVE